MNDQDPLGNISIKHLRAAMEALNLQQKPAKTPEEALTKSYQFWNTQPVPKMGEVVYYKSWCVVIYRYDFLFSLMFVRLEYWQIFGTNLVAYCLLYVLA